MRNVSIGGYICTEEQFGELLEVVASEDFQEKFTPLLAAFSRGYQQKYSKTVPTDNAAIFFMGECKGREKQCNFLVNLKELMLKIKAGQKPEVEEKEP